MYILTLNVHTCCKISSLHQGLRSLQRWHSLEPLTWATVYCRTKDRPHHRNLEKEACGEYWWVMKWQAKFEKGIGCKAILRKREMFCRVGARKEKEKRERPLQKGKQRNRPGNIWRFTRNDHNSTRILQGFLWKRWENKQTNKHIIIQELLMK